MAAQIDNLSGGRLTLGLGIGWYPQEHRAYGISFPPVSERFDRLEETIEVCRLLWGELPATFDGRYYSLLDADCLPRPTRGSIPILVGGVGERRTLKLVAQYADEWCSECIPLEDYARKVEVLDRYCAEFSRDPATIRRSMVVVGTHAPNARSLARGAAKRVLEISGRRAVEEGPFGVPRRAAGMLPGGRHQILDRLGEYARLGLQEAVFKYGDMATHATADFLAAEIVPAAAKISVVATGMARTQH
jgi:alkanesulfonate monooxygenase SsuD/methylene tetrahydromethanopterin reductase-like flavin-dependent oxidoreductase (luciferase family)